MKKAIFIFLLLLGTGFGNVYYSQNGGPRREKKVKTKRRGNFILNQYKSHGHADEFARGSTGRRSRFYKLFHRPKPAWRYKSSGSRRSHYRDNRDLFTRERAKGHVDNSDVQARQSSSRSKNRDHGNRSFKRKKYKRK